MIHIKISYRSLCLIGFCSFMFFQARAITQAHSKIRTPTGQLSLTKAERLCQKGDILFNHKDYRKALPYLRQAAQLHNGRALYLLGLLYKNGDAVPKNLKKARELFKRASDQHNTYAMLILASMYERGIGGPKDIKKTLTYLDAAYQGGNMEGARDLGEIYEQGKIVKKNPQKSVMWYKRAIHQNDSQAEFALGKMLYHAHDAQHKERGIMLLKQAAHHHNKEALALLKSDKIDLSKTIEKTTEKTINQQPAPPKIDQSSSMKPATPPQTISPAKKEAPPSGPSLNQNMKTIIWNFMSLMANSFIAMIKYFIEGLIAHFK